MSHPLNNISPLDGRYKEKVAELSSIFSESGLIKTRILIECEYLISLSEEKKFPYLKEFSSSEKGKIRSIYKDFSLDSAKRVKEIEKTTNHDVKAVEYFIKEELEKGKIKETELVHFALTSEDINSTSYALMLKEAVNQVLIPELDTILSTLKEKSLQYKNLAFPARTHGQSASPTTLGKEILVFYQRLKRQKERLKKQDYLGKFAGATGNFSSFHSACNGLDWMSFAKNFLEKICLRQNLVTTQIEPHDFVAEICDKFKLINTVFLDISQDFWRYISDDFFAQKLKEGEVVSSAMPHKVNPIDFENAEGNFGLANSLFEFFSRKLPVSRLQRDLSDSTSFRNLGAAFAHTLLGFKAFKRGFSKISPNLEAISNNLKNSWELLAEPIQTILRCEGVENPYEKLKELTRGKKIDQEKITNFVNSLDISKETKNKILLLRPEKYVGLAEEIVEEVLY